MSKILHFSVVDYVLFGLTLLISSIIGVYYSLKKQSSSEYLTASRKLPFFPMVISLMASFVSGISLLSFPAEIYTKGIVMCWRTLGLCVGLLVVAAVMLPPVYKTKGLSMYTYLEQRFKSQVLRFYGSVLFTMSTLLWASVALYAPSISLAGVTGVPLWTMVISMGAVCTLYTTIGGLKAVVWTDAFQALLMYGGLIAIAIKGTLTVGGIDDVIRVARKTGRLDNAFNIDLNPFQYLTLWTALFGGGIIWMGHFGSNQIAQQRYRSMATLKLAQCTVLANIPFLLLIYFLIYYAGLVMLAYYQRCDPLRSGKVAKSDQLTVYFMLDIFENAPGVSGLMLACISSATLSTVSSGIHALATVSMEDFVRPFNANLSERQKKLAIKAVACFYGCIITGLCFACESFGGVFQAANKALGGMEGPLVGLLLLGMIVPWSNEVGGLIGVIVGSATTSWLFIGAAVTGVEFPNMPTDTSGCNDTSAFSNLTLLKTFHSYKNETGGFKGIYYLSSHMYSIVGMVLVLVIGSFMSFFFKLLKCEQFYGIQVAPENKKTDAVQTKF